MEARWCICPGDVPVCPNCGHRYSHVSTYSDGSKAYTSKLVRDRIVALYGEAAAAHVVPVEVSR